MGGRSLETGDVSNIGFSKNVVAPNPPVNHHCSFSIIFRIFEGLFHFQSVKIEMWQAFLCEMVCLGARYSRVRFAGPRPKRLENHKLGSIWYLEITSHWKVSANSSSTLSSARNAHCVPLWAAILQSSSMLQAWGMFKYVQMQSPTNNCLDA